MADLLTPDDHGQSPGAARPRQVPPGARPWDRHEPVWPQPQVVPAPQPTRMAQRRALQAEALREDWSPDPSVTAPELQRVEDELVLLLDRPPAPAPLRAAPPTTRPSAATRTPPAADRSMLPQPVGRSRWVRLLAVLIVLAVAATAVLTVVHLRGRAGSQVATAAAAVARQHVVALALAQGAQVTGISVLASGAGPSQQVLVPSRLVLDVPGAGRVPMTQALAPGRSAVGAALADALDLRVDATWVLDTGALAALVDRVGGVVVDVDVDVTRGQDAGAAVLLAAGPRQRLSGAQAASYAQWLVGSEPEASRLARQDTVVEAVLGALPVAADQRRSILAALPGAPTGPELAAVVDTTGGLRAEAAQGRLASTLLPVNDIDAGGESTSYGLDEAASAAMVRSRLAGAALAVPVGGRTRVLVQNGVGTPGLGDAARSRLVAAGLRYVGGGNVEGFGVAESLVLLPDGSSASRARGAAVVKALGLTAAALRVSDTAPTIADLVVVLGRDFGPGGNA